MKDRMFAFLCSNRFETLLESLLDQPDQAHAEAGHPDSRTDPFRTAFTQRHIIVPSSAVQRRIELAVADQRGICSNITFSYLAEWLRAHLPPLVVPPVVSLPPEALSWRIFAMFTAPHAPDWLAHHPRLSTYLARADAVMRFELATRIAHLFEHYLIYRPDWIEAWAAGESIRAFKQASEPLQTDAAWQGILWRALHPQGGLPPILQALHTMASAPSPASAIPPAWPQCVDIFCLPAIPPLHLALLRQLARRIDIRLYVLNPCREFWFDIVDTRRLSWLTTRQQDLFHETGNRLLAGWGKQTQAYISQLFEGENEQREAALFIPPAGSHLLARLQNAVLDLTELRPGSITLAQDDRSIEVHVCHSFMRELEVLHDRLLALFAARPDLSPADILVAVPDLQQHAPLIDAVFGTSAAEQRIPWRITGLGQTFENPIARTLDQALTLAASTFPISDVFSLLQQPPVAAHFEFSTHDLDILHEWIEQAGIHWGLDEAQRAELGLDSPRPHPTLENGLDRLFLAWASGDTARHALFAGQLGAGRPEGSTALMLGRFWRYVHTLNDLRTTLRTPASVTDWRQNLTELLSRLVGNAPAWAHAYREVHMALSRLSETVTLSDADPLIPLDVLHTALLAELDNPLPGGMPGGVVTFAALSSLRALPYRVICIPGLNRGVFPGTDHPAEFDLIAAQPRPGDRQRRLDERNLFLDLVLASREILHLSYTGRSVRDGSEQPPSILIDELLDTLASACASDPDSPAARDTARARLTVFHPLQPFSEAYFCPEPDTDARLISFNPAYAQALKIRRNNETTPPSAFFPAPLPAADESWRTPSLDQLTRFFRHPCRFILTERIGLALTYAQRDLEDAEPFTPSALARKNLSERLLPLLLQSAQAAQHEREDIPAETLLALAQAGGEYPAGLLGEQALNNEIAQLREFAATLSEVYQTPASAPYSLCLDFDLGEERWSLTSTLSGLRPFGQSLHRYANTRRPADYLTAWLNHLVLCLSPPEGVEPATRWFSRDGLFRFTPCTPGFARDCLHDLLVLYREGLSTPLPFFPKTAWTYIAEGKNPARAIAVWENTHRPEWSEQREAAYPLILGAQAVPLEACFALATRIFEPLRAHLDDPRLR